MKHVKVPSSARARTIVDLRRVGLAAITAIAAILLPATLHAQSYTPAPENLENREWFQDAKFGLFVHWGVYSVLGVEEWVMQKHQIDKETYEKVASFFNPVEFDAEEWVLMAKDAGMNYITITAKHHDGFVMFDSEHTDWDIVDGARGRLRLEFPAERRPDAERQDPAGVREDARRDRRLDGRVRRLDLRHARRPDSAADLGRHHALRGTASSCTCSTGRATPS